jgi:hypothetical protein
MTITVLFGCAQVETSVRDMDGACAYMADVLGGGPIEERMAREISELFPNGEHVVRHVGLGDAVFQLNQPSPDAVYRHQTSVHQRYLDTVGPSVTNLNFYVDDAPHAHALLTEMGAETSIEGPVTVIPCFSDYGADNMRPADEAARFYFMGTRPLIGLDLEFMETTFRSVSRQTLQYPAYLRPRPQVGDGNLQFTRLRLVVEDLYATYANLTRVFAPASRSRPYERREGPLARSFRAWVAGVELEYVQPLGAGPAADHLQRFGPGVEAIEFAARDAAAILARTGSGPDCDLLGLGEAGGRPRLAARERIGFDVVLASDDERFPI